MTGFAWRAPCLWCVQEIDWSPLRLVNAEPCSPPCPSPRRYAPGDPIESWLHELLCLDAAQHLPKPPARLPHPSDCELFFVERDTLFSYHK